jgi:hypothetical protein
MTVYPGMRQDPVNIPDAEMPGFHRAYSIHFTTTTKQTF